MKKYTLVLKTFLALAIMGLLTVPASASIATDISGASTALTGYAESVATIIVGLAVIVGAALFVRGLIKRV